MAVAMFGGMRRYNEVSRLRRRTLKFDELGGYVDLQFDRRRRNSQFRQGTIVIVSAAPSGEVVCPVRLLRDLRRFVSSDPKSFVFRGFNGRLVAKSPGKTMPLDAPI